MNYFLKTPISNIARQFFVTVLVLLNLVASDFVFAQRNLPVEGGQTQIDSAKKEKRIALVIGNNNYLNARLAASINDAQAMTETLRKLNFDVVLLEDASQSSMNKAIGNFTKTLSQSDAVGLFYFAGHGVQSNSKNFLIPVDAKITKPTDIERQGIDIQSLLDKFGEKQNGMNILILDACRDNPFSDGGVKRSSGLAAVDGPPGTIVAFATAPGKVAQETGDHGAYTRSVLKHIAEPGLPIEEIFKRVRLDVLQATNNAQVPWENTSLVRDFYFKVAKPGQGYRPNSEAKETEEWEWSRIEGSKNLYDFIGFLRRFPHTKYELSLLDKVNGIFSTLTPAPPELKRDELPFLLNESTAGIDIKPINRSFANSLRLPSNRGVLITNVKNGSAAQSAGVLAGDVLLSVNGVDIQNVADLTKLAKNIAPGESFQALVWRNGQGLLVSGFVERASIHQLLVEVVAAHVEAKNDVRTRLFINYLARAGDATGQRLLGLIYLRGVLGELQNYQIAVLWLTKAAKQNDANAAAILGNIYLDSNSGYTNYSEGFRLATLAAAHGSADGAAALAIAYAQGVGTSPNHFEAVKWSRVAALQNNPQGMYLLGLAYDGGIGGLSKDMNEAKKWFRQASELKYAPAIARLKSLEGQ